MLEFKKLCVAYDGAPPALKDFTLAVRPGEIVALVGESGSGKTTAIRAAMGLLPPGGSVTGGSVALDGRALSAMSPAELQAVRGRKMAMAFQDAGAMLDPIRTIGGQFVEFIIAHERMSRAAARELAEASLAKLRLPDPRRVMRSFPFQLSGGQKQRVGLAMAMAFGPEVLLADEPTSALDVTTQAQIVRQMMELRADGGTAIVIVTHNMGVAAYMADRILVMKSGETVWQGSRETLLNERDEPYVCSLLDAVPDMRRNRYV